MRYPRPTPEQIRQTRLNLGLTQEAAAACIRASLRAWQAYEAPEGAPGHRTMHPGLLVLLKLRNPQFEDAELD